MQGKKLNSGIRGGLWDAKHSAAMGEAVWLFGWLVHRQTTQRNGQGLVLRGRPLTYAEISADTGWAERTLHRWMQILRRHDYIQVRYSIYSRMVIRVLNAKKFSTKQLSFPQAQLGHTWRTSVPNVAYSRNEFSIEHKKKEKPRAQTPAHVPLSGFPSLSSSSPISEQEQRRRIEARDRRLADHAEVSRELRAGVGPACHPGHNPEASVPEALELLNAVAAVAAGKTL